METDKITPTPKYCTQNAGYCLTCRLVHDGRDCMNHEVDYQRFKSHDKNKQIGSCDKKNNRHSARHHNT